MAKRRKPPVSNTGPAASESAFINALATDAAAVGEALAESRRRFEEFLTVGLGDLGFSAADRQTFSEALTVPLAEMPAAWRKKGNEAKSANARAWQDAAKAEYKRLLDTDPKYRDYTQDAWSIELEQHLAKRADRRFTPKAGRIVKFMREHPDYFRHS